MFSQDFIWWVTVIDIPAMSGLFWMIWKTRKDNEIQISILKDRLESRSSQMKDGLSAFKLEVAKSYAQNSDVREIEKRLVSHLIRIEAKLDSTALKAEALNASK